MKSAWLLIAILLFASCQSKRQASTDKAGEEKQTRSAHPEGTQFPAEANILKGKVLEKLDVAEYTYLRLATASGETWAAVLKTDAVSVGAEAAVVNPMSMDGFESRTLKRKFEKIVFGTLDRKVQDSEAMRVLQQAHAGVSGS